MLDRVRSDHQQLRDGKRIGSEDYEEPGQSGFGDDSGNYQNQYSIADGQQPLPYV